ncbi:AlbA family DNA-binding domain-containing protein [Marinilabilia rubra]|uniref:ATP-binding protein n=1 Tax=Marinilabilia rubra TaxID=2162893 RepID=A0A2U2BCT5_9BACT|nr:ATP-binding protein [Marinilabilia rubra]PWE00878.1 ATP-binding protein [Marinilabilia rubra]
MNSYLKRRIAEGEHLQQDFKFAINDSKKIARSLTAFANTEGGRLLVGVKDNGRIAGVSSEEEFYMVEAAANRYCKPPIAFEPHEHKIEGKTVVEIIVPKSDQKPHKAPTRDGKYKVYVRVKDQNLLANRILLKVWMREKKSAGTFFQLQEPEQILLTYLNKKDQYITHSKFTRIASISRKKAEKILVNLIVLGILEIKLTENGAFYCLREDQKELDDLDSRPLPGEIKSI